MMRSRLIVPDSLRAHAAGMQLTIRLPWYRTLPLSVIDLPRVLIDGARIDPSQIRLTVNGQTFDRHSIRLATEVWWYVLDPATVLVGGVTPGIGEQHRVAVEVDFAPPYISETTLSCAATQTMAVAGSAGVP